MSSILTDFNDYLDRVKVERNNDLFEKYLSKWGENIVPVGLGVVVDRIRQLGDATIGNFSLYAESDFTDIIFGNSFALIAGFQDVVVFTGSKGYHKLLESLAHPDEDIRSVVALELASRDFVHLDSMTKLKTAYQTCKGTGCQLAISIALGAQNNFDAYKKMLRDYLLRGRDYQIIYESTIQSYDQMNQDIFRADEKYSGLTREARIDKLVYKYTLQKAMGLVVLNTASRGRFPQTIFPNWKY